MAQLGDEWASLPALALCAGAIDYDNSDDDLALFSLPAGKEPWPHHHQVTQCPIHMYMHMFMHMSMRMCMGYICTHTCTHACERS